MCRRRRQYNSLERVLFYCILSFISTEKPPGTATYVGCGFLEMQPGTPQHDFLFEHERHRETN